MCTIPKGPRCNQNNKNYFNPKFKNILGLLMGLHRGYLEDIYGVT
jgi:hypothetical protein